MSTAELFEAWHCLQEVGQLKFKRQKVIVADGVEFPPAAALSTAENW